MQPENGQHNDLTPSEVPFSPHLLPDHDTLAAVSVKRPGEENQPPNLNVSPQMRKNTPKIKGGDIVSTVGAEGRLRSYVYSPTHTRCSLLMPVGTASLRQADRPSPCEQRRSFASTRTPRSTARSLSPMGRRLRPSRTSRRTVIQRQTSHHAHMRHDVVA